ncbi:Uncharacterized protein HA466_0320050 [Hirschfeldia incana]|nr:Uncharacterized protein HA466_0320050 [Hirschfeldia incana]
MEEVEDGDASSPFWLQSRLNNTNFHRTSSLDGRATTVAIQAFFAGVAAILIVFFIIPPFFSSASQFLRPHVFRKSWDYLNFVLVLFAVICGFLSRNTGEDENNNHNKEEVSKKSNDVINGYSFDKFSSSPSIVDRGRVSDGVDTPRYWIGDQFFPDQTVYKRFSSLRSSSSYPDLRVQEFESDERWRFYDDTRVSQCRYEALDPPIDRNQEDGVRKVSSGGSDTEEVVVEEDLTSPSNSPHLPSAPPYHFPATPSPPPSPPLPSAPPYPFPATPSPPRASKPAKRETKRLYQNAAPITPVPAPAMVYQKSSKEEKKKGGASKDFLIALRRKKKKQRQQSIDGLDLLFGSDPPFDYSPPPPPPPPPPLSHSSKKGKSKRTKSSNPPPPPPPPPPPYRSFESLSSMAKIHKAEATRFFDTGSESPPMRIPPPPPPPPFKMPAWKFVKRGDYVRMASNISISSDEPDDDQSVDGKTGGSMFCPSPDVDTKADDFIARFRAGLKLEKINSVKRRRSNLGPEPGPDESES